MNDYIDIDRILTWQQAIVVVVLILAVVVWPGILGWLNARAVKRSVTTNNGGSTVKDQLDRIERHMKKQDARSARHGAAIAGLYGRVKALEKEGD